VVDVFGTTPVKGPLTIVAIRLSEPSSSSSAVTMSALWRLAATRHSRRSPYRKRPYAGDPMAPFQPRTFTPVALPRNSPHIQAHRT